MINWLQTWFLKQCDGNWEHEQVIKIESLDNPGWSVEIDFNNTLINVEEDISYKLFERDENNWIGYEIKNNIFCGIGDPSKLYTILELFKDLATHNKIDEQKIAL